ncbi:MAG: SpoIID/LytB domain-containing protein [Candidatus Omnitrophota bacterium]
MKFFLRILLMTIPFVLFGAASLEAMGSRPVMQEESRMLRVAVATGQTKTMLRVSGSYEMRQLHTGTLIREGGSLEAEFSPGMEGLRMNGENLQVYGVRIIPRREATLFVNQTRFRGIVDVIRQNNMTILVVNHLGIESYLYGVLPYEIPHDWPDVMLEVQAILARSYALYKKIEHQKDDYDVVATVLSQHYGGREREKRRLRQVVDRTAGKVLTDHGTLFPTFYHSTCAGQTEDAQEAMLFKEKRLPLRGGVRCTYCEDSPFYRWERSFLLDDIAFRLRKGGYPVRMIRNLRIEGRTNSGRVKDIRILHEKGEMVIPGPKFRLAISPVDLRSTKFDVTVREGKAFFKGGGWGHGAGLCQYGAYGMAKRGYRAEEILLYYYPGSEIRELPNIPWHE